MKQNTACMALYGNNHNHNQADSSSCRVVRPGGKCHSESHLRQMETQQKAACLTIICTDNNCDGKRGDKTERAFQLRASLAESDTA